MLVDGESYDFKFLDTSDVVCFYFFSRILTFSCLWFGFIRHNHNSLFLFIIIRIRLLFDFTHFCRVVQQELDHFLIWTSIWSLFAFLMMIGKVLILLQREKLYVVLLKYSQIRIINHPGENIVSMNLSLISLLRSQTIFT